MGLWKIVDRPYKIALISVRYIEVCEIIAMCLQDMAMILVIGERSLRHATV